LQNHRVGAPRILNWQVRLKSLAVLEDYEEEDCEEPNEVFLNARAFLSTPRVQLPPARRFPNETNVWLLPTGETLDFGAGLIIDHGAFDADNAPESPLLYIEFGAWEDDDEKDLMGLQSGTLFLADLLSSGVGEVADEITPEGLFVRRVKQQHYAVSHGFPGSDDHCYPAIGGPVRRVPGTKGKVAFAYEVEVTWLKRLSR
jgi:hypothetical protein